jgi:hypothetical protein
MATANGFVAAVSVFEDVIASATINRNHPKKKKLGSSPDLF